MLSQREESATPSADKPVRAGAVDRPCLRVEPWLDDLIDEVGHDPRSEYVETFGLLVPGQLSPQSPRLQRLPLHPTIPANEPNKGAVCTETHDMQGPT